MPKQFYDLIQENAKSNPDKPAVIDGEIILNYNQLLQHIEQFAGALTSLNLTPESKLGILCLNQKENLVALLASFYADIPVIPLNPLLTPEDLAFIVKDAAIDILLVNGMFAKPDSTPFYSLFPHKIFTAPCPAPDLFGANIISFEEFLKLGRSMMKPHQRASGLPDVLLYTSGSTAKPIGVPLEESQFIENSGAFLGHLQLSNDERCIVALPMFHSFGNIMVLTLLRVCGTLILLPQFHPKTILSKIDEHQATLLPLVPTIYAFLVDLASRGNYDISSLRMCISGGASLPEALLHRVESILGVTVLEGYGLTETTPVISVNKISEGSTPGSVGPVVSNLELSIVDDSGKEVSQGSIGEIWVRGPTVMKGYWNRPEDTKAALTGDGWFKTGDLGHLDEKNRLYISAGRKKDLIIRAGENVSPLAIENALMNHPGVIEVAAVGVSHPRLGEQVKVYVVRRDGWDSTEADLKEFCRKNLPAFMPPNIIQFIDALPKTASGKVIKAELRGS